MTDAIGPIQALQNTLSQLTDRKIDQTQFQQWKELALKDQKLDKSEARFLMDQLAASKFEPDVIPAVTQVLSEGFTSNTSNPVAYIGGNELTDIHKVSKDFDLAKAKSITDQNFIDEIYFKDEQDNLYVAYGSPEQGGALNLDRIKVNYVGRLGDKKVTVVHINNETNTTWEGVKAPWKSTINTLKDAGQTGIVKGIGEMATTLTAMFIGKTVLENGIKTVSEKTAEKAAETVVEKGAEVAAQAATGVVGKAKALGSTIGQSIKSSMRTVVVGGAVAGAVVGTVVTIGSGIGAVKSRYNHRDYTTLDMVTGHY
ncbi:hypothetical protein COW36_03565 [bacterium (Candidatus Blackallbacteria) CG17_big_fil_post_rev_8_21_14_2_50_48_46]|uniref:Uncharacterized protein n=1 Tax=bacterium (Candidatus Blackallbacteria) CG17_big_fil_post_rev_8_21_14_2_50_48_46 TaxID=2014261 RepID=A0A2M7G8F2_9BACT|nr:MAG: hypothetical protein COW64_20735 [bacterium (Candidatus Blackallbacteria) CG18_big_fil_WC_8_21_14_2_50_49_26]PIW18382.1 MAG: hypothetical protein COW36_03565 [bacterium (Candidatus Blackallbacteria) CG17_big_fil_post_rev_8_21_14_2_50_48_46]PIW50541.1 MAG: hypothetical protein COW20_01990 [bacterium (Candidatus Blackallbacteria) CG13_big_fil_rev_8_21_14_2_50_49_14]